jgi:anti-sigma-K factor RskA
MPEPMSAENETPDDAALAAEYALHLMDAAERRAFERRMLDDAALRDLVRDWDEAFVPLAGEIPAVTPPGRLKEAVLAEIAGPAAQPAAGGLSLWRLGGGIVAALALAVALIAILPDVSLPPAGPLYTAEVAAQDRSLLVTASFDPAAGAITVQRVAGGPPPGRVLELWLIADGAAAPVSLGVLPEDGQGTLAVPVPLRAVFANGVLAISDEPPGGSPTGAPTGSVLATGTVTLL